MSEPPRSRELHGKCALVTGAARGFGRAVAHLLAEAGADVAIADLGARASRSPYPMAGRAELELTVAELRELGVQAHAIEADVTRAEDCERMTREAIDGLGGIDILVANAGGATSARAWELTEADWDFVHEICLKSVFLTTRAVIPHMIERRAGKIVLTASRNGLRVERGYAHYNAAKAGVIHYGKSLALELGPYEVNVNVVCPTQMADKSQVRAANPEAQKYWDQVTGRTGATYEEFDAASGRDNLFERGGQPDYREVAEGVLWLVSERARLVTGLALPMDAGWIVKRGG
ncbi:MAG: SDR family NAD(P)-dependent oxidoreductase [Actinomycetota bacterium]|nr:SDR family NAD(P)-dependent oxidoreductase [Actinomycetota bacterium]